MLTGKQLREFHRKWSTAVISRIEREKGRASALPLLSVHGLCDTFRVLWLLAPETKAPISSYLHCTVPAHVQAEQQSLLKNSVYYLCTFPNTWTNRLTRGGEMFSENAKNRAAVNRSHYSLRWLPLAKCHSLESSLTVCGKIKPCAESTARRSLCFLLGN